MPVTVGGARVPGLFGADLEAAVAGTGGGACWRYFRRLLWSRCETSVLGESVEKNDPGMWQPCSFQ